MKVVAGIRPEDFLAEGGEIAIDAEIRRVTPMGAGLHVEVMAENRRFLAVLRNHTTADPGTSLQLGIDPWTVHVFDAETEKNLCCPVSKEEDCK